MHYSILTERVQKMLPYDWKKLVSFYASLEGISIILFQMDYHYQTSSKMDEAIHELKQFYDEFESEFITFFEELQNVCNQF